MQQAECKLQLASSVIDGIVVVALWSPSLRHRELWQLVKMKSQPANWVNAMKLDTQKWLNRRMQGCAVAVVVAVAVAVAVAAKGNFYSLPIFAMLPSCQVASCNWQVASMTANAESTTCLSL